jgi:hypothetical protein
MPLPDDQELYTAIWLAPDLQSVADRYGVSLEEVLHSLSRLMKRVYVVEDPSGPAGPDGIWRIGNFTNP